MDDATRYLQQHFNKVKVDAKSEEDVAEILSDYDSSDPIRLCKVFSVIEEVDGFKDLRKITRTIWTTFRTRLRPYITASDDDTSYTVPQRQFFSQCYLCENWISFYNLVCERKKENGTASFRGMPLWMLAEAGNEPTEAVASSKIIDLEPLQKAKVFIVIEELLTKTINTVNNKKQMSSKAKEVAKSMKSRLLIAAMYEIMYTMTRFGPIVYAAVNKAFVSGEQGIKNMIENPDQFLLTENAPVHASGP